MQKPCGASGNPPAALVLCPEAPYPIAGGGAMRTASLLEYLSLNYCVDAIIFREPGDPDPRNALPAGLLNRVLVIDLPYHSRTPIARATRNARRFARGQPPLVDRFSGFEAEIARFTAERQYALGVIEHFWCAPYASLLRKHCERLALNLHNVESMLLARCANAEGLVRRALFQRFAAACRSLEEQTLPYFSVLLVSSEDDADSVAPMAPDARVIVYPNSIPYVALPNMKKAEAIVFSGNLEYHPNQSAIAYFHKNMWPALRLRWPKLIWRLIGRNHENVKLHLNGDDRIEVIGPVGDAISALAEAKIAVAPLLAGSGTRVKIIEAWAAGLPVVSTSIGAEGLPCQPGRHFLLADTPEVFCDAISCLLQSEELRAQLGASGRKLYEEQFTWNAAWERLQMADF
jgi:glycosyltransferase involved in cell wall biosynthesis